MGRMQKHIDSEATQALALSQGGYNITTSTTAPTLKDHSLFEKNRKSYIAIIQRGLVRLFYSVFLSKKIPQESYLFCKASVFTLHYETVPWGCHGNGVRVQPGKRCGLCIYDTLLNSPWGC